MYSKYIKCFLDIAVSLFAIILLSPVLLAVGIMVAIGMGWPVIFKQQRAGKNGVPFTIYKFRTMKNLCGPDGALLPDEERNTLLGLILRRFRIDELPELINIAKGDMSFVGPRPLFPEYLRQYGTIGFKRHVVRPGLTGWAQVNGNTELTLEQKIAFDIWYVDYCSLGFDLLIIFKTLQVVLQGERINAVKLEEAMKYAYGSDRRS